LKKIILILMFGLLLVGCSNAKQTTKEENWKESSLFESGSYTMIGEKERLGFIYDDSEVLKFYPNKTQKYMWHFWGEEQEFNGKLKVVATHFSGKRNASSHGLVIVSFRLSIPSFLTR
jgi:hypothetical protein